MPSTAEEVMILATSAASYRLGSLKKGFVSFNDFFFFIFYYTTSSS
jgi:hypothetical protein